MTSRAGKHKVMVNLTRRLLIGEGATPLESSGSDDLWLPGGGRVKCSGARQWPELLDAWNNIDVMPNHPMWRAMAFVRPQMSEPVVMMRVEQFGRLVSLTEQALVESGRLGEVSN